MMVLRNGMGESSYGSIGHRQSMIRCLRMVLPVVLCAFCYLGDLIGDATMRLAMDRCGGLFAGCLTQTEDRAIRLLVPIVEVGHPVFSLDLQVLLVCLGDSLSRQPLHIFVHVHVHWHRLLPSYRLCDRLSGCQPLPSVEAIGQTRYTFLAWSRSQVRLRHAVRACAAGRCSRARVARGHAIQANRVSVGGVLLSRYAVYHVCIYTSMPNIRGFWYACDM